MSESTSPHARGTPATALESLKGDAGTPREGNAGSMAVAQPAAGLQGAASDWTNEKSTTLDRTFFDQ